MKTKLWLLMTILCIGLIVPVSAQTKHFNVGDKVDFTVKDENGKSVKLSKYKGKVIALVFYASW